MRESCYQQLRQSRHLRRGELVLLDSRGEGGGFGGGSGGFEEDFGGSSGGGQRSQSRPQPAAFDTDLDDDVPF